MQALIQGSLPLVATRYTGAAGLTVLIYDHILLLDHEVRYIWKAKNSWFKWLFLFNRYSVPLFLLINTYVFGPVLHNISTQFCRNWIAAASILPTVSACAINTLVAQRIYALWGWNKTVLKVLRFGIGITYTSAVIVTGIGIKETVSFVEFNSELHSCITNKVPKLFGVGYGISLGLDLLVFCLLCLNALDRPRNLHTIIIKQLYLDGIVYFLAMIFLQGINVALLAGVLPIQYSFLFSFLTWAIAPASVHRVILSLDHDTDDPSEKLEDDESEYTGLYVRTQWKNPYVLRTVHTETWKS